MEARDKDKKLDIHYRHEFILIEYIVRTTGKQASNGTFQRRAHLL
jgi:hypothetical protein